MGNELTIGIILTLCGLNIIILYGIHAFFHSDHRYRQHKQKFYDYMEIMEIDDPDEAFHNVTDLKTANKKLESCLKKKK